MEVIVNSTGALVYVIDLETHEILYANDRCIEEFGNVVGEICFKTLQKNQNSPCTFCPIQQSNDPLSLPIGTIFEWENQNSINNHHYFFNDRIIRWKNGQIAKVQVGIDITKQKKLEADLKMKEAEIIKLAHYDILTELPNRLLLKEYIYQMIKQNTKNAQYGALLLIDLDQFKTINDTKGHDVGDMVLVESANRIRNVIQHHDTLSRTGGDEFFVLINTCETDKEKALTYISTIAKTILDELQKPYFVSESDFCLSASIGITLFADEEDSIDDLMKYADSAMYNAKANGRNTFNFFDPKLQQIMENKALLIERLRKAVEKDSMTLFYQPQIVFVNHFLQHVGVEALIRWNDPDIGIISPGNFIPVAEESGLIVPLGEWVLREAVKQLTLWNNDPIKNKWRISINVSYKQFEKDNFVSTVESVISTNKIQPEKLRLELTESLLVKNTQEALDKINHLKGLGLSLSIDDFGTGYSSLSYLKQLPIDELKIDQSFIRDLASDQNDVIIVETILSIGQKFGLEVIAEGVETEEQYEKLVSMGCKYFQGYLFGRPVEPKYL
ncbi:putative bifunctional diguanylate cyclase/phosphodiesterase [Sulfuricurvum sp.]|uniref:putative bifunctional diguanylate cyclase/phosphodiesterase n=1 Tax=Sulfuricurvum sp. TaxID=2025608 RepID=UPI002E3057F2|nr:EAL domain-containing protein [Sulfuricurvum sp.]HEX5330957.1 EAL domain-containing protein [Sulfuricurvum sp.]